MTKHLWQSTVFALLAAALALSLRDHRAAVRYWIWLAASLKFLVPFVLLVTAARRLPAPAAPISPLTTSSAVIALDTAFTLPSSPQPEPHWQTILYTAWALGTVGAIVSLVRRYRRVRTSPILEPGVFGIFRPKLILPAGIERRLTPEQLLAIVEHEKCHIRRRDNLFAAIHMVVESLFWFHPIVWWIGARLLEERERACDEEVLRLGADPGAYATGILEVCKLYLESPLACVSGVTGADLKRRIAAIMAAPIARRLTLAHKAILAAAAAGAIAIPVLIGVVHAQQDTFEVASVKPADPAAFGVRMQFTPDGGVRIQNAPLLNIVMMAYDVERFQISGNPAWMDAEQFVIEGKGQGDGANHDAARRRLQALLSERFHLKVRRESKEAPVYTLLVDRNGHKLKNARDGMEGVNGARPGQLRGDRVTMDLLARVLSMYTGRPVLDRTGLKGDWAFDLEWTFEGVPNPAKGGIARMKEEAAAANPPDPNGPSLFTAIQEQLGLRLESTKGPVESIVIEHIERPTAN